MTDFDALAAWQKLADHLNAMPLPDLAGRLGLHRHVRGGIAKLVQCPRYECRSPLPIFDEKFWACSSCGAAGGGAALFAAHIAGWLSARGEDDAQVRADIARLALNAAWAEDLIPIGDPDWREWVQSVPGSESWTSASRGIYEGDERAERARALATELARGGFAGIALYRLLWAWTCAYCRPPLGRTDLAGAVAAAMGALP